MIENLEDVYRKRVVFNDAVSEKCRQSRGLDKMPPHIWAKKQYSNQSSYPKSKIAPSCRVGYGDLPHHDAQRPHFFVANCLRCGNYGPCKRHHVWYAEDVERVVLCLKCHSFITSLNTKSCVILMKTLRIKVRESQRPGFKKSLFQFFLKNTDCSLETKGQRHKYLREFCYQNQASLRALSLPQAVIIGRVT